MKKSNYLNPRMLYKQYRKFCNLQRRISLLMRNGDFFALPLDIRNRMLRRLKLLYKRLTQLSNKQKLRWAAAAMAVIFSASVAHANFEDPVPLTGIRVDDSTAPVFADVDGDGDLDIVTGNYDGTISYYENEDGVYTQLTGGSNPFNAIDVGFYAAPSFANIDGDSDLDLVIGEYGGQLYYYRNDAGTFTELSGASNPFDGIDVGYGSHPTFVNFDGDSDMDVVVGDFGGLIHYLENSGGNYTEITGASNPFDGIDVGAAGALPHFADLDGDSDLDLFVGDKAGLIHSFQNDSEVFTELTGTSNPFNDIDIDDDTAPWLIDGDGDSDLDLVIGDNGETLRYFENNSGTFAERTGTLNPYEGIVGSSGAQTFSDIDGDSDLDLVISDANSSELKYFENIDGEFIPDTTDNNPFKGIALTNVKPILADVDGDEDDDLVVGNELGTIQYFVNDAGTYVELTGASNPFDGIDVGDYSYPAFGDVEGDGDLDLFIGEKDGYISYYKNVTGSFMPQTGADNPVDGIDFGISSQPVLADFDRDGDVDMMIGRSLNDTIKYYENNAGTLSELEGDNNPLAEFDAGIFYSPEFQDLDADGDLDLYLFDINGHYYFVEYMMPGITVNTGGSLNTTEAGGTATFTLVLDSEPSAAVTIELESSDTDEGTVSPVSLTFTPGNWETPQEVTITGVDDTEDDGNIDYSVSLTVTSADAQYNGMSVDNVPVSNTDDEGPIAVESAQTDDLSIYVNNRTLVLNASETIDEVHVFSITGNLVANEIVVNSGTFELQLDDAKSGIYIVQVTVDGHTSTSKVVLK